MVGRGGDFGVDRVQGSHLGDGSAFWQLLTNTLSGANALSLSNSISMETTIAGVKYQPLEGRPLPGAGCYGNLPPPPILSLSPGFSCGEKVGVSLGLAIRLGTPAS